MNFIIFLLTYCATHRSRAFQKFIKTSRLYISIYTHRSHSSIYTQVLYGILCTWEVHKYFLLNIFLFYVSPSCTTSPKTNREHKRVGVVLQVHHHWFFFPYIPIAEFCSSWHLCQTLYIYATYKSQLYWLLCYAHERTMCANEMEHRKRWQFPGKSLALSGPGSFCIRNDLTYWLQRHNLINFWTSLVKIVSYKT